jgi:hypothetical protein
LSLANSLVKLNLLVLLCSKRRIALEGVRQAHVYENGACEAQTQQHKSLVCCKYKGLAVKISEDIESAEHYHRTASESEIVQECCDCSREILSFARTEAEEALVG